jgi:hypothetical protein
MPYIWNETVPCKDVGECAIKRNCNDSTDIIDDASLPNIPWVLTQLPSPCKLLGNDANLGAKQVTMVGNGPQQEPNQVTKGGNGP